jgi:hypothetical protein
VEDGQKESGFQIKILLPVDGRRMGRLTSYGDLTKGTF